MQVVRLSHETDFEGWRRAARALRLSNVSPDQVRFVVPAASFQGGLFDIASDLATTLSVDAAAHFNAPKALLDVAQAVVLHRSTDRFDLLYRLLWRLKDDPHLMRVLSDPDVADAMDRVRNVSRASHKMKAFVRFRKTEDVQGEVWVAWFEPAHRVLERTAPFFVNRFTTMRWSILTPDGSATWKDETLTFGPPAQADQAPQEDEIEAFWQTYYASTFNPARLKTRTMQGEMPRRYWKNLPEAALIPALIAASADRTEDMVALPHGAPNARMMKAIAPVRSLDPEPEGDTQPDTLQALNGQVAACRRCSLWRDATQAVAGQGPAHADIMIVGEQPGDQEDLAGRPFVGPAGKQLDEALAKAGIDRQAVFVTNAVRHFKHDPRGQRRLHRTPDAGEVSACRVWLDHERRLVRPRVILALGATAAQAVLNRKVAVMAERGRWIDLDDGVRAMVTVHPAYLLRLADAAARIREEAAFIDDLRHFRAGL